MRNSLLLLITFCTIAMVFASCDYRAGRNEREETGEKTKQPTRQPANDYTYKIFLENSGSMDGYVRGVTAFEDDLYKLLVDISYLADTVQVNYINTRIIPYESGIQPFINSLEPEAFRQRGGNRSNSNLHQIFQKVLEETGGSEVSLLISDYIFSIGSGDTEKKLNNQKISIYNTFRRKLQQEPFATLIIKLSSEFNGNYYDKNDRPVTLDGVQRPYYVWLMGKEEAIEQFKNKIGFRNLQGFQHTYMLTASSEVQKPFYTVLNNFHKIGNFRADRDYSGGDYVHGIRNVEAANRGAEEGQFGFSIAVDMSGIPVDRDYLINTDNYRVNESYRLENVQPIAETNQMNARDLNIIEGKATHILTFMANGKSYADLTVALKKQTPAWVKATQTNDDTNIKNDSTQQDKTFGFGYLVEGVEEAYQNISGQDAYFSIEVSVKK